MKTNRLFEILYILLSKQRVTAGELADHFEVSTRTIYRDIDTIGMAGIPIYTEKGKGGGISLLPDFVLNKSLLDEQEQLEILSTLQGLSHISAVKTNPVLQKLSTIFNKTATNWLEVDFSEWGFESGDLFNDVKTAILRRHYVEFDYFSSYSQKTRRRVEPIQLWFKSRAWYLKAFCLTKQDVRVFRLTRVRNLTITDECFSERNLSTTSTAFTSLEQYSQLITLRLKIAPEMTHRVLDEFANDVEEKLADGSFIVLVTWPEDNWLYSTIFSLGEYVEVLEPEHMRNIICEKVKKIAAQYL